MKSFTSSSLTVSFLAMKTTITTEMLEVLVEVWLELELILVCLPRSEKKEDNEKDEEELEDKQSAWLKLVCPCCLTVLVHLESHFCGFIF